MTLAFCSQLYSSSFVMSAFTLTGFVHILILEIPIVNGMTLKLWFCSILLCFWITGVWHISCLFHWMLQKIKDWRGHQVLVYLAVIICFVEGYCIKHVDVLPPIILWDILVVCSTCNMFMSCMLVNDPRVPTVFKFCL